jgi:hypothetical protein
LSRYIPAGVTQCADRVSDCSELAAIREFDRLSHLPSASNGWLAAAAQLGFLLPPKSL